MQSCVLSLDTLLKQICFLICHDKWLSFISPSLRPRLLAFGTPLGAAPDLCFGYTLGNVTVSRCAFTWPSVNTCSESNSSSSTPKTHQGSLASNSLLEFLSKKILCPPALEPVSSAEESTARQVLSHQEEEEGENKVRWIIHNLKYSKEDTETSEKVTVFALCMVTSIWGWKSKFRNQQLSSLKYRAERLKSLIHYILIPRHYAWNINRSELALY